MVDLVGLRIERAIVHQVHGKTSAGVEPPVFSARLAPLDRVISSKLIERIVNSFGRDSTSIVLDIERCSSIDSIPILCEMMTATDSEFIELTQVLAMNLSRSHFTSNIPGGALFLMKGRFGPTQDAFISVFKAESEDAFSVSPGTSDEHSQIRYIDRVFLAQKQRTHKAVFLFGAPVATETGEKSYENLQVFVFDINIKRAENNDASQYFYRNFLGCKLKATNGQSTKCFFEYTRDFIKSQCNFTPEQKVDLHHSLYDYLQVAQTNLISVSDFSDRYFSPELQDQYSLYMREKGVTTNSIVKDLSRIEKQLKRHTYRFSSNVKVTVPFGDTTNYFIIDKYEIDGDYTRVRITGRVEG